MKKVLLFLVFVTNLAVIKVNAQTLQCVDYIYVVKSEGEPLEILPDYALAYDSDVNVEDLSIALFVGENNQTLPNPIPYAEIPTSFTSQVTHIPSGNQCNALVHTLTEQMVAQGLPLVCQAEPIITVNPGEPLEVEPQMILAANYIGVENDFAVDYLDMNGDLLPNPLPYDSIPDHMTFYVHQYSSGNACWTGGAILNHPDTTNTETLVCYETVNVSVVEGEALSITPEMVLEGNTDDLDVSLELQAIDGELLPNPLPVGSLLTEFYCIATDNSTGNQCQSEILVFNESDATGVEPLACIDQLEVSVLNGSTTLISPDMVLENTNEDILQNTSIQLYETNEYSVSNLISNPIDITAPDTIYYRVTLANSEESCWASFIVKKSYFSVCDTLSHCTQYTDCTGGHTADDNIEWPCNIEITHSSVQDTSYYTPQILESIFLQDSFLTRPIIVNVDIEYRNNIYLNYHDTAIFLGPQMKIIRTWTVLDWYTTEVYSFTQIIKINYDENNLVQLPDLEVDDPRISPRDLVVISKVQEKNAWFDLGSFVEYEYSYIDQIQEKNDEYTLVNRTWIADSEVVDRVVANQLIKVNKSEDNQPVVTIQNQMGVPLGDVLVGSVFTNTDGTCNPEEDVTTYNIDAPSNQININELYVAQRVLLNIQSLTEEQALNADVNGQSGLTLIDVLMMQRDILGVETIPTQIIEKELNSELAGNTKSYEVKIPGDFVPDNLTTKGNYRVDNDVYIYFDKMDVKQDESNCFNMYVQGFDNISTVQFKVGYDSEVIEITEVSFNEVFDTNTSFYAVHPDRISVAMDFVLASVAIDNHDVMMEVCFDVVGNIGDETQIYIKDQSFTELTGFEGENMSASSFYNLDLVSTNGYIRVSEEDEIRTKALMISYEDKLLNAGEYYDVPLYLKNFSGNADAYQAIIEFDEAAITLTDKVNNLLDPTSMVVVYQNSIDIIGLKHGQPILYSPEINNIPFAMLHFKADKNALLSDVLKVNDKSMMRLNKYHSIGMDIEASSQITSGSIDFSTGVEFDVYPNPVSEILTIDTQYKELYQVSVVNLLGKTVVGATNTNIIDVKHLQSGMYILNIRLANGEMQSQSFVKQ